MSKKLLFVTAVPSFYKSLLFTELEKAARLSVFYSFRSPIKRDPDFFKQYDAGYVLCQPEESVIKKIRKLINASRYADYIYYNAWDDPWYWFVLLISPRKKNILVLESSIYEYSNAGFVQKILNMAKSFFLSNLTQCIVSGTPHGELVRHLGYKGKINFAFGVGLLDFKYPPQKKQLIEDPTIKNFLFIGRISRSKGIDLLLPVFKDNPQIHLHLAGEIEDDFSLEQYSNITYVGYKKRSELRDLFAACDVFILPSRQEPWGLVVEEALYHGLPVIVSSRVGCNKDVIEKYNAGIVFELGNRDSLEQAILRICRPEQYRKITANLEAIDFDAMRNHYIQTILENVN